LAELPNDISLFAGEFIELLECLLLMKNKLLSLVFLGLLLRLIFSNKGVIDSF